MAAIRAVHLGIRNRLTPGPIRASIRRRNKLHVTVEHELKYFAPCELLRRCKVDLARLPFRDIFQSYFPPTHAKLLLRAVKEAGNRLDIERISSIRLRRTVENGSQTFSLDFKGPGKGMPDGARIEVSATITEKHYVHLLKHATYGFLHKRRYLLPFAVSPNGSRLHELVAEIDLPKQMGRGKKSLPVTSTWVTIDVEVEDQKLIKALRRGRHDLTLLKRAVELETVGKSRARLFGAKRLARWGVDSSVRKAAEKLSKQVLSDGR